MTTERFMLHKFEMLRRRQEQRTRQPDVDAQLVYYRKNSLPDYRKDYVRKFA